MSQGTFGVNWNEVDAQYGPVMPEPGRYTFRITKLVGSEQKNGENAGARCYSAICAQLDDKGEPTGKTYSKFLGLGTVPFKNGATQLGVTKGWIEMIGRSDVLDGDQDPELLVDTEFEATISYTTGQDGRKFVQDENITSVSHADAMAAPEPPKPEKPASTPRRGR